MLPVPGLGALVALSRPPSRACGPDLHEIRYAGHSWSAVLGTTALLGRGARRNRNHAIIAQTLSIVPADSKATTEPLAPNTSFTFPVKR
jgi:hypothetical protein